MSTGLTLDLAKISIFSSYVPLLLNLYAYHLWKDFSRFHSHPPPDSPPLTCICIVQFYSDSFYLFFNERVSLLRVKNLLTVLSNRGGRLGGPGRGLGSTRPAATEDKETDKRAEEARSD